MACMGKWLAELCRGLVHEVAETPEPFAGDATRLEGLSGPHMVKLRAVVILCKGCDARRFQGHTGVCSSSGRSRLLLDETRR